MVKYKQENPTGTLVRRRKEEKEEYENKQNDLYLKLSQSVDNNTAALNKLIMRMEDKK